MQDSPSVIYARLTAPNGTLVERIIAFIDNKFKVYEVTNAGLRNIDDPYQNITLGNFCAEQQKYYNLQFAQSGNRVYFAGRYIQPGYFQVDSDNASLVVSHYDVLIRDLSLSRTSTRVQKTIASVARWFECIEAHTSDANNSPGDGVNGTWQRYWIELDGAPASGTSSWGSGTSYTSNFIKRYNKLETITTSTPRPQTVEFFAGRVWLAGEITRPNMIYFSQVITKTADIEYYFQYADPNNTDDPDLVDDDGGTIELQGADIVYRLIALSSSICACAGVGIWQITGQNSIFKATSFSSFIALNDGIFGPECVTKVHQNIVIFGKTSIWFSNVEKSIAVNTTGQVTFKSLSEKRIQTMYNSIPDIAKQSGRVLFNPTDSRVYFFYNDEITDYDYSFNSDGQPGYSKNVLVFDTLFDEEELQQNEIKRRVAGAFFKWELEDSADEGDPYIACAFVSPSVTSPASQAVVVDGEQVQADGEDVVAEGGTVLNNTILVLALNRNESGGTTTIKGAFGVLQGSRLRDWYSDATYRTAYTSRVVSGIQSGGDIMHKKFITYLYFVFKKVESGVLDADNVDLTPGGCYLRTGYNFSTSETSAKYGSQVQIYKPYRYNYSLNSGANDGHDHTWYKHKARGRGNAMQVIIENDGNKDFHLIGWAQQFAGKND
jgi:hypothetical protein